MDGRAREWFEAGSFFEWSPGSPGSAAGDGRPLKIFNAQFGDRANPALVLVHGFPTCSIDWFDVVEPLAREHWVCVMDFPGYGFSDKPRDHPYALDLDRALVEHYVSQVLGLDSIAVVAHDRGDSVALALADSCATGAAPFELRHLVLSNANIFLPLSNLTRFQRLVLDAETAPQVLSVLTPEMFAAGVGDSTFTPSRGLDDPAIQSLAQTFAYNDGIAVLHDTIQYLFERADNERVWLDALARSSVPTTMVWGLYDTVSPLRVATHVWESYVSTKPGANELWLLPHANHYLQHDQPQELVEVVTTTLAGRSPDDPGPLSNEPNAPILLDRSRPELPSAASVLAIPASLDDLTPPGGTASS
jgi:pimeloyl-ACP methyl ester carboxylesterase